MLMTTRLGMIILVALVLAACRTAPIQDVVDAPVVVDRSDYTVDEVRRAILRAGTGLGWNMQPASSNAIIGTLNIRQHMAQVEITYDKRSYSIRYRDSENLQYDGQTIHNNYNGWVQHLDRAIKRELIAI
jgi:hypothetical protein